MFDRYAAAQHAALTTAAEATILEGTTTAAAAAGPTLEDLAAEHARAQQVHCYLDAVEAEARGAQASLERAFDAAPSAQCLDSLTYVESVICAALTARRLLRTPGLLAAALAVESSALTAERPWRLPHGRLALHLISSGSQPGALERLSDLRL